MQNHICPAHILSNPKHFVRVPAVFAAQWERLKEARGQTVNHERIGPSQHIIATEDPVTSPDMPTRIRAKVRRIALNKGYIEPYPPGVA